MRIIKVTKSTVDAERRLAAIMYCMERGERCLDDDGKELKAPFAKFPQYTLPTKTDPGIPIKVAYKPSVGVIFYSAGAGFSPRALAERLREAMDAHGDAHLRTHRVVAVTPSATLRHKPAVVTGTEVAMGEPFWKKSAAFDGQVGDASARLILVTREDYCKTPPHVSFRSSFTWIIMNGATAIGMKLIDLDQVNATVASIFYDSAGILVEKIADNTEIMSLKLADFNLPVLPTALAEVSQPSRGMMQGEPRAAIMIDQRAALIVDQRAGTITVAPSTILGQRRPTPLPREEKKWGTFPTTNADLDDMTCFLCHFPLFGTVVIMQGACEPADGDTVDGCPPKHLLANARILGNRGAAICQFCAAAIPNCARRHIKCTTFRSKIEKTQAEALKGTRFECLIPIITGGAPVAIAGVPGAFTVGGEFVLKPGAHTPLIEIGSSILMALGLPIVRYRDLVEVI